MSSPSQVPMLVAASGTESPDDSLEEILTNELLPKDDPLNSSGNSSDHELLRTESGERKPPVVLDAVHVNVDLGRRRGGHGHSTKPGLAEDGESTSRSDTLDSAVGSFGDDSDLVIKDTRASSDLLVGEKFSPDVERKDAKTKAPSPQDEAAVLEVEHIAYETPSALVKTQPSDEENVSEEKKSLQRRLASLQRQSKMDDPASQTPSQPLPEDSVSEIENSTVGKKHGTHVVDVEVKIRGMNSAVRPKPKLKSSASLATSSPPVGEARSKLGKQDQRWWSLEIPSIRVRSDDDPPDDPAHSVSSRKRHFSADETANSVSSSNASLQVNYDAESVAENIRTEASNLSPDENNQRPSSLGTFQGTQPMNYAQRRLLTKSVGRTSGSKLQGSYSLDVPDTRGLQPSHSLGTLDQNTGNQKQQFQVVEDKLISSSLTRLETPGGRRLSWTPDYGRRSSKGSVQGKEDEDVANWLRRKGRSFSEHHSSTPTLDVLVSGINMASYERFDKNGAAGTKDSALAASQGDGNEITDTQIEVEGEDGKVTFYELEKKNGVEYIADPAGDPFAPKSTLEFLQSSVQRVLENFYFRAFTIVVILLDFILIIVDLTTIECATGTEPIEIASHVIICYFVLEIALRIFYQWKNFFYNWLDDLDLVVVLASFIIDVIFLVLASKDDCEHNQKLAKLVVLGRAVRIIRMARIIYIMVVQHRQVARATRQMVSQNKRRYQKDGFDLDLCYITERVIAMSFPSKGMMAMYRNPVAEVARFFNTKHKSHYRIYNLCSERDYNESLFFNNVERVYIDDHNVPKLREMLDFTANAREWMGADKQNVIAIHCKGGKGRTGTMICTWLIDCGLLESAQESLEYFGDRRTDLSKGSTFQGVETPSQSRYVEYYERMKNEYNRQLPPKKVLKITSIKIIGINSVGAGDGSELFMELRQDGLLIFECNLGTQANCEVIKYTDTDCIVIKLINSPNIQGDIKIMFKTESKKLPIGYDKCPFYFWFYTSFIEDNHLHIPREWLDNPHKKKTHNVFRENFAVELNFEDVPDL